MSEQAPRPGGADPELEQEAVQDDAVIGRAFRWSLLAIVLAAALGGAVFWLGAEREAPAPPVQEAVPAAPATASRTAQVSPPAVRFTDITREAGIDFVHRNGAAGERLLPETMGSGAAFFDYDNDGDADLLLVSSDLWPEQRAAAPRRPTLALYANDGTGRFTDVSAAAGLELSLYGMGVAVGDYDADGWRDLYITALGRNRLLRNVGGRFQDVTETAGVAGDQQRWSTSAGFFDYDNDGDLDLFVANYVRWSPAIDKEVDFRLTGIGRAYGPPTSYQGSHSYLYRNEGTGRFTDVSEAAGIQVSNPATGQPMGKALALGLTDVDGDGYMDVLVANDTVQNFFFHNLGDGTFEETGAYWGLAFDRNGHATGAMGVDAAHYRNDASLAFAIGNFANEMTSLYVSQEDGTQFADDAILDGVGPASRLALSFGLFFFDYDLDGRLDLLQANGHLESEINQVQPSQHYAQPAQLFWGCGTQCPASFVPVDPASTGDLATPLVGRAATYADVDGDADLDVLITQNGRRPYLFRNDQDTGHGWLRVRVKGRNGTEAIGAWVQVRAGEQVQRRQVMPTRSYLSQVEPVLTFGLGEAAVAEQVRVRWPDGSSRELRDVAAGQEVVLEPGAGVP